MPPKKLKSSYSLNDEFKKLGMRPANRPSPPSPSPSPSSSLSSDGSDLSNRSVSSYLSSMSSLNNIRHSTPANDFLNAITDEEMSEEGSNVAVRDKKKPKAKKSQSKSAKLIKSENQRKSKNPRNPRNPRKTKRGGRTPKEVYYKYSPNTGKRIRMTTKKKKITGGDERADHGALLHDLQQGEMSKYKNTLFEIIALGRDREYSFGIYKLVGINTNRQEQGILIWKKVYIPPDRWREDDNETLETLETGPGRPLIYLPYSYGSMPRA